MFNLLESPDLKKAFDANTKWDVVEAVSNCFLGVIRFALAGLNDGKQSAYFLVAIGYQLSNHNRSKAVFIQSAEFWSIAEAWAVATSQKVNVFQFGM